MLQIARTDIAAAAENIDLSPDEYSIREAYEGRGMYGRTCAAVDLPSAGKVTELLVALAMQMTEEGQSEDVLELARKTRTDSMGLGVVAYWPGVEITD